MLAYVFWHWPRPDVMSANYERDLIAFHAALSTPKSPGFLGSAVVRGQNVPWITASQPYYEDWYLVEDFVGSTLSIKLPCPALAGSHMMPSPVLPGGHGRSLSGLRSGAPELSHVRWAAWLDKPDGQTYADFYASLQPWTDLPARSLWQRQMTLGPAREFCLFSADQPFCPRTCLLCRRPYIRYGTSLLPPARTGNTPCGPRFA